MCEGLLQRSACTPDSLLSHPVKSTSVRRASKRPRQQPGQLTMLLALLMATAHACTSDVVVTTPAELQSVLSNSTVTCILLAEGASMSVEQPLAVALGNGTTHNSISASAADNGSFSTADRASITTATIPYSLYRLMRPHIIRTLLLCCFTATVRRQSLLCIAP